MALPTPVLPSKTPSQIIRLLAYLHGTGTGTSKITNLCDDLQEIGAIAAGGDGDPLLTEFGVALKGKGYPSGTIIKAVNYLRAEAKAESGDTADLDELREFHSKKMAARERTALKKHPVKDSGPDVGKAKAAEMRARSRSK